MTRSPHLVLGKTLCCLLLAGALVAFLSPALQASSSKGEYSAVPIIYSIQVGSAPMEEVAFSSLYSEMLQQDARFETRTVTLNGERASLLRPAAKSIGVKLPDDRLAVKVGNEKMSILPNGSTVSEYQDEVLIHVPDLEAAIAVSSVVTSPVKTFTDSALLYQTLDELDHYQVSMVFPLAAETASDAVVTSYTVEWGDGAAEDYSGDKVTAAHTYNSSGVYYMKIHVTDSLGVTYSTVQLYQVKYEGHLVHSYLWLQGNKGPVSLMLMTGLGFLGLGAMAFTESGKYRLLMFLCLFFPMYSRIQKEDVLDQFVRGQIYGYIKTNPGVHYNQILREVGVKNGTLSYHLGVLEKTQLIKSRREGLKYRAFYPTSMMFPKEERFRLTELQIRIIESITAHPGSTQKEISKRLDQKPQTINYNVKVLEQAGIISVKKKGRKTRCYPPEAQPSPDAIPNEA